MGGSVLRRSSYSRRDFHLNDNGGEDSPSDLAYVELENFFLSKNRLNTQNAQHNLDEARCSKRMKFYLTWRKLQNQLGDQCKIGLQSPTYKIKIITRIGTSPRGHCH
ncbi:hypothetical protein BHE74_00019213 [Ensete ventricosum]|nr:hypothetical protein BHE74_00019213 [Ensete ventricosum]